MELNPGRVIESAIDISTRQVAKLGGAVADIWRNNFGSQQYVQNMIREADKQIVDETLALKDLATRIDSEEMVVAQCEVLVVFYGKKLLEAYWDKDYATMARCVGGFREYFGVIPNAQLETYFKPESCEVLDKFLGIPGIVEE